MKRKPEDIIFQEIFAKSIEASETAGKIVDQLKTTKQEQNGVVTNIRIPVPWGHVAGKWWGPKNIRPIVALHGWLDNAGSFDTIIPLLPPEMSYLALDLPGHGFSSRYPYGMSYSHLDYIRLINMIRQEYNWEKISLMGHSMGSVIGFFYAALFPDFIDLMIGLDYLKTRVNDNFDIELQGRILNMDLEDRRIRAKGEPPNYSYNELVNKLCEGTNGSITKECCPYILVRGVKKSTKFPNKYYFNRDGRTKHVSRILLCQEDALKLARKIKIPYLYVKAEDSDSKYYEDQKYFNETVQVMKDNNPQFEFYSVRGKHHVHLTNPDRLNSFISNFIRKYRPINVNSKL